MSRSRLLMILSLGLTVLAFNAVTAASASATCRKFLVDEPEFRNVSLTEQTCLAVPQTGDNALLGEVIWLLIIQTAAEWLSNGATVTSELLATTSGEFLLEEANLKVDILCSGSFGGTIGSGDKGLITLMEDLEGHDVTSTSTQKWVNCFIHEKGSCEEANETLVEVFPLNLPWETTAELIKYETGLEEFVDSITNSGENPGFLVECKILGIKGDATCTGNFQTRLENSSSDVTSNFNEDEPGNIKCTSPLGEGTGLLVSTGSLIETSEGTLSVS